MAHQCAQNLHVGKMIARGAWFVAVAGTAMRPTFALRAATSTPPIFAAASLAFVFAGPRAFESWALEPLVPLFPCEYLILRAPDILESWGCILIWRVMGARARACAITAPVYCAEILFACHNSTCGTQYRFAGRNTYLWEVVVNDE